MTTALVSSLQVRRKILASLKADATLVAMFADRMYPDFVPAGVIWPFLKVGVLIDNALRVDCADGSDVSGAVHVYVKGDDAIPDPQAFAITANSHIARVLDAMEEIALDGDASLSIDVQQAQEMQDGTEASARHGFVTFEARAL